MAIVAFVLSKQISRPLIKLKKAVNEIANGNFDVKTDIKSKDEIGELSTSFDYMSASSISARRTNPRSFAQYDEP